jgi:hypothetical protein
MKRLLAALLCICAPVYAQDPKVEFFTPDATGCMILRECKEDVVQITNKDQLHEIVTGPNAELVKEEFGQLINAITGLGIEIYIAPARYFGHQDQGIYHTKYNAVFLNLKYMRNTEHLIGTLRHEGWHLAQDCMAGTLDNSFVAVIMHDDAIPEIHKYLTTVIYADNPAAIPWEQEAKWAEATKGMTIDALKACKTGAMWEIYEPTPLTKEYLIDYGFLK